MPSDWLLRFDRKAFSQFLTVFTSTENPTTDARVVQVDQGLDEVFDSFLDRDVPNENDLKGFLGLE